MTLGACYREGRLQLENAGVTDAAFDAQLLFEAVFGMNRQMLLLHGEEAADEKLRELYLEKIAERACGRPLQYILGEWEFCGLPFFVGEGVLIPREETALLVDAAKHFCQNQQHPAILDLCSGSGAIAVACAKKIPQASVTACELSPQAISFLKKNIEHNQVSVCVERCDVLCPSEDFSLPPQDVILSNPPYIESSALPGLQREVRREPSMALDGGADGLDFYRAILKRWLRFLRPGGMIAVECGLGQAHTIEQMFQQTGLTAKLTEDFAGIERMVWGQKPESDCNLS